jgi:hypothetical protein
MGAYSKTLPPYRGTFMNANLPPLEYMLNIQDFVRQGCKDLSQDSEIQNEVDGIATLVNHVVYRLKFLK